MANINSFLKQLTTGDSIRDYAHANKIFGRNNLELTPKYSFLFHVFFDLAPGVSYNKQNEVSVLVKTIDLPRFDVNTKTYNSYNRQNIVQSRIVPQPITIVFHDDSANVIRNFWFEYYNFYYRSSDLSEPSYYSYNNKYASKNNIDTAFMGYTPKNDQKRYLQSIRIYSMSRKQAAEYILVNPIITQFQHGRHDYNQSNSTLEHTMTIEYETVLYKEGATSAVKGFAQEDNYDKKPSPIAPGGAGTRSILGPGGLFGSASSIMQNVQQGNFLSAAFGLAKTAQTFKGTNLKNIALSEVQGMGQDILRGQNPFGRIVVPTLNSISNGTTSGKNRLDPSGNGAVNVTTPPPAANVVSAVSNSVTV